MAVWLHRDNDGLWFQGDAPRHAMNGAFWRDFIASGRYLEPYEFAKEYYSQYPAITPTLYPPTVYLVMAGAYQVFGISTTVARGVIVAFALIFAVYMVLLSRRLGRSELGGWLSLLVFTQPAVIKWTNAVMLEMPALALALGATYHIDRSLRDPGRRHLLIALVLGVLCAHTRPLALSLPLAYTVAAAVRGEGARLFRRDALLFAGVGVLTLVPFAWVTLNYGSIMIEQATYLRSHPLDSFENWTYYLDTLAARLRVWFAALAGVAILAGFALVPARAATARLVIVLTLVLLFLGMVARKDPRYGVALAPLAGLLFAVGGSAILARSRRRTRAMALLVLGLLGGHALASERVPAVDGMREAVHDIVARQGAGPYLYEGVYDGNFIFAFRAEPRTEPGCVIRGGKLFYVTAILTEFYLQEYVRQREDVKPLVQGTGCRWVVLERAELTGIHAAEIVRSAIESDPRFRLDRSYPVSLQGCSTFLDVYEFLDAPAPGSVKAFDAELPVLGRPRTPAGR